MLLSCFENLWKLSNQGPRTLIQLDGWSPLASNYLLACWCDVPKSVYNEFSMSTFSKDFGKFSPSSEITDQNILIIMIVLSSSVAWSSSPTSVLSCAITNPANNRLRKTTASFLTLSTINNRCFCGTRSRHPPHPLPFLIHLCFHFATVVSIIIDVVVAVLMVSCWKSRFIDGIVL